MNTNVLRIIGVIAISFFVLWQLERTRQLNQRIAQMMPEPGSVASLPGTGPMTDHPLPKSQGPSFWSAQSVAIPRTHCVARAGPITYSDPRDANCVNYKLTVENVADPARPVVSFERAFRLKEVPKELVEFPINRMVVYSPPMRPSTMGTVHFIIPYVDAVFWHDLPERPSEAIGLCSATFSTGLLVETAAFSLVAAIYADKKATRRLIHLDMEELDRRLAELRRQGEELPLAFPSGAFSTGFMEAAAVTFIARVHAQKAAVRHLAEGLAELRTRNDKLGSALAQEQERIERRRLQQKR